MKPRMPGFTAEASLPGSREEAIVLAIKYDLHRKGWRLVQSASKSLIQRSSATLSAGNMDSPGTTFNKS